VLVLAQSDLRLRSGVKVAAGVAAAVMAVPLVLGLLGPDYFLSRNLIPAWVPLATAIAGACALGRPRLLGAGLAAALISIFAIATVDIASTEDLQRPNWRALAHVIGAAPVPRAIVAAGGATVDPLRLYLPGVSWDQRSDRKVRVREIDVVGTFARLTLTTPIGARRTVGVALPALRAPAGTIPVGRVRFQSWIFARFALPAPRVVSVRELAALAFEFFHHTPSKVQVFTQGVRR
jgi:hypothetical protein